MIMDERMAKAAAEANRILVDNLPDEGECKHVFSPEFEKKMKKLLKRTEHPLRYRFFRTVAAILLISLLGVSAVLTINTEARERLFSWIREQYFSLTSYSCDGDGEEVGELKKYDLGFLPEGYEEIAVSDRQVMVGVAYANNKNQMMHFSYVHPEEGLSTYIDTQGSVKEQGFVGRNEADIYLFEDGTKGNVIVWVDAEEKVMFSISGYFSKEELIEMAESVAQQK